MSTYNTMKRICQMIQLQRQMEENFSQISGHRNGFHNNWDVCLSLFALWLPECGPWSPWHVAPECTEHRILNSLSASGHSWKVNHWLLILATHFPWPPLTKTRWMKWDVWNWVKVTRIQVKSRKCTQQRSPLFLSMTSSGFGEQRLRLVQQMMSGRKHAPTK